MWDSDGLIWASFFTSIHKLKLAPRSSLFSSAKCFCVTHLTELARFLYCYYYDSISNTRYVTTYSRMLFIVNQLFALHWDVFWLFFFPLLLLHQAIWENQFYYLFGFLFLVFIILVVSCSQISIVMVYFQLCAEVCVWGGGMWMRGLCVQRELGFKP